MMISNKFFIYFTNIILLIFVLIGFNNYAFSYVVEKEPIILTASESVFINKYINKVELLINEKGLFYKNLLVTKINKKIENGDESNRGNAILNEIVNRINLIGVEELVNEEFIDFELDSDIDENVNTYDLENIDLASVKHSWIGLYNNYRSSLGLNSYVYNSKLEKTAFQWSKTMKSKGVVDHRRNYGDSYYDYRKITSWFSDRGVNCKNINGVNSTENIGWGQYSCNDADCTDELTNSIKGTFDFFMSEKYKSYQPHYKSIVNQNFKSIGLGIELNKINNSTYKYYLTVHYCTEIN